MVNMGCKYWSEQDDDAGQSCEYCKASGRQCSCSGVKEECNNGQYTEDINEDTGEDSNLLPCMP
jgi:hypothetical protein